MFNKIATVSIPAKNQNVSKTFYTEKLGGRAIEEMTQQKADSQNSVLIKGNVVEEIAELKRQPGKDIGVSGAGALASRNMVKWDLRGSLELMLSTFDP